MPFADIKNLLPRAIQRAGVDWRVSEARVLNLFEEVKENFLPYGLGEKVKAMYIKNGTLAIASLSTLATQELTIKEEMITEYINKEIGEDVVKRFRYIV